MPSEPAAPDWYSHQRNRVAYYRLATAVAGALPRPARLRLARGLGRLLARACPRSAARCGAISAACWRARRPAVIDARVRETFANFGAFFADLLTLNRRPGADLRAYVASSEGEHHLDAAIAAGRGVVLLTAHLGNWEFAGRLLSSRGGRHRSRGALRRAGRGARGLPASRQPAAPLRDAASRRSTLGLLAALRRAELVAMQADRPSGGRGDAIVPFFGEPAAFPLGPFVLARATGAAVIPPSA